MAPGNRRRRLKRRLRSPSGLIGRAVAQRLSDRGKSRGEDVRNRDAILGSSGAELGRHNGGILEGEYFGPARSRDVFRLRREFQQAPGMGYEPSPDFPG